MTFRILAKNFASVTKAAFYFSSVTFCQKKVSEKKNQHFRISRKKILRNSVRNCWHDYQTFLLIAQKKILRKQHLHKRVLSNHFLTLGEKVSNFHPKSPSRAVRTAFYVSRGWIPGIFFWKYRILQFSTTSSTSFRTVRDKFLAVFSFMHYAYPKGGFWKGLLFGIWAAESRTSIDKSCGFF